MIPDRAVPCNVEAEQALLGACLIDPDAILLLDTKPEQFYIEKHAWVYEAIQALCSEGKPIDFLTVTAKLESQGKLKECGGAAYLTSLLTVCPTAIHVKEYAVQIASSWLDRKIISASGEMAGIGYEQGLTGEEKLAKMHRVLMGIETGGGDGLVRLGDAITDFIPEVTEYLYGKHETWGVPTGLIDLDAYIGGLAFGEMTLIAADPGIGKTQLAMTIAKNAAQLGNAGAFFSLEMGKRQLLLRLFADLGDVDTGAIRRGKLCKSAIDKMFDEADRVRDVPLWVSDDPKDTAAVQRDIMRLQRRLEGEDQQLKFAVVDYSDLLLDKGETEVVRMKHISHALKNIAKRTGVALVVVHTITREIREQEVEDPITHKRVKKEAPPQLKDLGWGRAWEYDAHTVLFPHHDRDRKDFSAMIKVGKYRDGVPNQKIDVLFDGKRWRSMARREGA